MRDIIRRLIRLLRIIWRQRSRPAPSLESITRKRLEALDRRHDLELAAFAFEMAVQPVRQKLICGVPSPPSIQLASDARSLYQSGLQNYRPQAPCPTAAQAAFNRVDYMLLKNSAMEFVYGRNFKYGMSSYMIACSIGLKADKVKDVEAAMSELMEVDDHLRTGNVGSERAYYFKW